MQYLNLEEINYIDEKFSEISKQFGFKKIFPKSVSSMEASIDYYKNTKSSLVKIIDFEGEVNILHEDPTISLFDSKILNEKIYYLTNTFSWDKSIENLKGGVENFCEESVIADAEIIIIANELLKNLNLDDFTIEIGHTHFIEKLLNSDGISRSEKIRLNNAIHNKNIQKIEKILNELEISNENKNALIVLSKLFGDYELILKNATELNINELKPIIDYLTKLKKILLIYKIDIKKLKIDLSLTNKYSYYDGMIFNSYTRDYGKKILQGGRYNNNDKHGVGFSFNILNLIGVIKMTNYNLAKNDYTVITNSSNNEKALYLATALRENGLNVNLMENELEYDVIKNINSAFILSIQNDLVNIISKNTNEVYKKSYNEFIEGINSTKLESIH